MRQRRNQKSILITGCSSGFGRITALELAKRGWQVFATVRKGTDQTSLLAEAAKQGAQDNLTPLICDITSAEQVAALAETVSQSLSCLDALLNNAGTALGGPVECLPLDGFRKQFEIDVIAQVGVIQIFLPLLKAARGTIVNVSSISGRIALPAIGAYAASKYALEAISDVLRIELAPFGVQVVIIEPSSSPTNIWETSLQCSLETLGQHRNGPYGPLLTSSEKLAPRLASRGFPPQVFADTVVKILDSRRPCTRYVIPAYARVEVVLRQLLPDRLWDRLLRWILRW